MADRLAELRWLFEVTKDSVEVADPEKRSPLIGQMRAILAEMSELDGGGEVGASNGLIDFQAALAERRQSASSGSRRS